MPAPRTTLNGYRPDLGTMFQFDQLMNRNGFIGHLVAPVFEAAEQAGTYGLIPVKQLLKEPQIGRNSRGDYNRTDFTFEDTTYATVEHGLEMPIDRRRAKIYRDFFDFETVCTANVLDVVLRAAEKRIADMIFNATTFASYTAAVSIQWDNLTTAVPITDVETAVRAVWANTGIWPDSIAINRHVFRNLRLCTQIIDKIASSGGGSSIEPGKITAAQIASCFDLKNVFIAGSARDSANEGQAVSISSVWSNEYAMIFKAAETNNIEEPCLARTLHWGEDGSQIGGTIETYYADASRGDVVRVRHETQEKIQYAALGYLLSNITT